MPQQSILFLTRKMNDLKTRKMIFPFLLSGFSPTADTKWKEFKEDFNKDMKKLGKDITDLKDKISKKIKKD